MYIRLRWGSATAVLVLFVASFFLNPCTGLIRWGGGFAERSIPISRSHAINLDAQLSSAACLCLILRGGELIVQPGMGKGLLAGGTSHGGESVSAAVMSQLSDEMWASSAEIRAAEQALDEVYSPYASTCQSSRASLEDFLYFDTSKTRGNMLLACRPSTCVVCTLVHSRQYGKCSVPANILRTSTASVFHH